MISIRENVPLEPFSFLRIGGRARYFAEASSAEDIKEAADFADRMGVSMIVVGEGSNTVFSDGVIEKLFLKFENRGIHVLMEDASSVTVDIAAGENWDDVVRWAVERGFSGIESLSCIPGSAGAAPIQNIGAYGRELTDVFLEAAVYDLHEKKLKAFAKEDCQFGYRDSIFRRNPGRHAIMQFTLRLGKEAPLIPDYPDVKTFFAEKGVSNPDLTEIRDAICQIRNAKLPDPKKLPNLGSFFKNPVVSKEKAEALKIEFPGIPSFPGENGTKIPAAWLIEQAGLKGKNFGNIRIYEHHALILVNHGNASFKELNEAAAAVEKEIFDRFGIGLEREPLVVR